jgi:hypothetical protein
MMFDVNIASAGHVRHYSVVLAGAAGWEAKVEEDRAVCWRETYEDWHRVERTLARVQQEVSELVRSGWTIETASR